MSRLSAFSGAALAAALLASVPVAQASAEELNTNGSSEIQTDWGVNTDGWQILVHNDRSNAVDYLPLNSFGMKTYRTSVTIHPGENALVEGKKLASRSFAVFGTEGSLDNRFVDVSKSGVSCGWFENNGAFNKIAHNGIGCEVISDDLQQVIEVRFTD